MSAPPTITLAVLLGAALALAGCTNPDGPAATGSQTVSGSPGGAGEPQAPAPPSAARQSPAGIHRTPSAALTAFAELYSNWSYRTLTAQQRTLAKEAVGSARLTEQQAAASSQADSTITRGHLHNSGQVLAVATDERAAGLWVVTTVEETTGDSQYQGLPAGYHVTLAKLARVPGGYAVSEWLPQS